MNLSILRDVSILVNNFKLRFYAEEFLEGKNNF
jgi:hypothetical protein